MKYDFECTFKSELNRVLQTFSKKEFYIKYGYKIILPKGFTLKNDYELGNLKYTIKQEMDHKNTANIVDEINKSLKINNKLQQFYNKLPFEKPNIIKVQLTKYGVGGSYLPPNKIIINLSYKIDPFETLVHETIHLLTEEPVVQKYKLTHPEKEGLVDWIMINSGLFQDYQFQNSKNMKSIPPSKDILEKTQLIRMVTPI